MTPVRRRVAIGVIVGASIVALAVIAVASGGDDANDTTSATLASSEPSSPVSAAGTAPYDPLNPPFQRALQASGIFDCVRPGQWQPYLDRPLVISVGEPPEASTCANDVIDLPFRYCSVTACSQIPPDWDIRLQPGVPPDALFLLVTPVDSNNARLYCYRNLITDPPKIAAIGTTIEQACPTAPNAGSTGNSTDIPYVPPPVSVDLPPIPPSPSAELPSG